MDKIDELITDLVRKVSNLGKDCYCEGDYMQQQSEIDDVRAALRAEYERLQARIAWFETALDTKELVYTKFLSDYQDAKAYIKNLDAAVDKLCPLVARACTKLTPPTIGAVNIRHIENQDAITDIYNRAYEALMIGMDVNSDRVKELEKELAALKEAQLKDPLKMTEDELREFLSANGYDYDDLRRRGSLFIANLKNKLFQPPEAE